MHRATWNKRLRAAEDRILEAGRTLLKKAKLPEDVKDQLVAAVDGAAHYNEDIRRLKRVEAVADLIEAAADPKTTLERLASGAENATDENVEEEPIVVEESDEEV